MGTIRKANIVSLLEQHVAEFGEDNTQQAYESAGRQFAELHEDYKADRSKGVNFRYLPMRNLVEACLDEAGIDNSVLENDDISVIAEAVGSSSFPNITKFLVHSEAIPAFERKEERVAPLFTELTATRTDIERIPGFTTPEGMRLTAPQEPIRRSKIAEKYAEIKIDKFTNSIDLTKEAIFNDRLGQLIQRASDIGQAAGVQFEKMLIQTIEILERTLLEGRESSTVEAAIFDGNNTSRANFYKNDHSAVAGLGGQVNDNLQTNVLGIAGLDAAMVLFSAMVDESGFEIAVTPSILLVHPSKVLTAWEITNSVSRPDSGNDAANFFGPNGARSFQVIESTFIGTSTQWYLGDFKKQVIVDYWQRPNIQMASKSHPDVFERDIVMAWKFATGYGMGHRDYRYIVNSQASS